MVRKRRLWIMWRLLRMKSKGTHAGVLCLSLLLCASTLVAQQPLYKNPNAPMEQRADDLLSRMSIEEKISQLMSDSPAIERLGVPAYNWWNECLHGVARAGRATVFPQTIGLAATWDTDLLFRVATAISDEARAKYHELFAAANAISIRGLRSGHPISTCFAIRDGAGEWRPTAKIRISPAAWPS